MHYASFNGCMDLLQKLIVDDKVDIEHCDSVSLLCFNNSIIDLIILVFFQIQLNIYFFYHQEQNTPLLLSSISGHYDMVQYLINNGANLNAQNSNVNFKNLFKI